ncbi:MAG: dTDP-glucose 4,6-dehydratase [Bdellovibrionaceae bacterium]|nr:dTDP-glucose 4,6-dehydratase [Pseudobdellovibrionaceae bacterium]
MQNSTLPKILVTGGAGFIGSAFVRLALSRGHSVIVVDLLTYAGHRSNLEGLSGPGTLEFIQGDICDAKLIGRLLNEKKVDWVINFAAESHVDRSIDAPATFIETNIRGTFTLLSASLAYFQGLSDAGKAKFRYLQVSTDEVYGSLGPTGRFVENSPLMPNSPYSASKTSADLLARAWHHTYGLPVIITRCSNNYGPRQFPEKLIPLMITRSIEGGRLPVYGDGQNVRDWIHVEDHCEGLLLALERGRPDAVYCFGGNAEKKNLDLVKAICSHLDRLRPRPDGKPHDSAIQFVEDRLGHDRRYAIDDGFAQKELGFKRRHDFESGIEATVRWYLENSSWIATIRRDAAANTGKGNK